MTSFVVFSDLHLHQWQYGSTIVHGRNSRLVQQTKVVQSLHKYCLERDINEVVFCGDLFHTSTITAEVSKAAYEAFYPFYRDGFRMWFIVGNHDQVSRTGGTHALDWFRYTGTVIDTNDGSDGVRLSGVAGRECLFVPYLDSREELEERLAHFQSGFIFLHQGVGGVEVNSKGFTLNEILTPDLIPSHCSMAFTGHYHSRRAVTSNLIIPGSTCQLNWGDEGEDRGWLEVRMDGDSVKEVEFINSEASKFITINENQIAANDPTLNLSGNFIRVMSQGNYSPEELQEFVLNNGAASVEIKRAVSTQVTSKFTAKSLPSFNEMVINYATRKEDEGVINAYDKEVGEALLREAYQIPSV